MYNVTGSPVQPLKVTVIANSAHLEMKVDTRASTSISSVSKPTINSGHRIKDHFCNQQLLSSTLTEVISSKY